MITDDEVERALEWMAKHAEKMGAARQAVIVTENWIKNRRAQAFLEATGSNIKEREAKAEVTEMVNQAIKAYGEAESEFQYLKMMRDLKMSLIEAWRTQSSNRRVNI